MTMPREVPSVLSALADLYRKSVAGAQGGARDFICDYEQLLRHARCHDGDERESAEDDLKRAEVESGGLMSLDRAPRSGIFQRVRLSRKEGETWLFGRIGEPSPAGKRTELGGFFKAMAQRPVPEGWADRWRTWCGQLERNAHAGNPVQPFKRDDPAGNDRFLAALLGVIHWRGESLIRFASSAICGDSKRLENLEALLVSALRVIHNDDTVTLEDFGILRKPRTLSFHGPLVLTLGGHAVNFTPLPGPSRISETNLIDADDVITTAAICVTVENEDVFLELAKRNRGWLLVHTSFPGSAVRRLFQRLSGELDCRHFGDSDPAGFDILRDLRERTGRMFRPVGMEFRPAEASATLTQDERRTIDRLLGVPQMADVHSELRRMLEAGNKGAFEQESVDLEAVISSIGALASAGPNCQAG